MKPADIDEFFRRAFSRRAVVRNFFLALQRVRFAEICAITQRGCAERTNGCKRAIGLGNPALFTFYAKSVPRPVHILTPPGGLSAVGVSHNRQG